MTKKELLEKLRKKSVPAAAQTPPAAKTEAPAATPAKAEPPADAGKPPAAAEGGKPPEAKPADLDPAKMMEAIAALSDKMDMIGEALATILDGKATDPEKKPEDDAEDTSETPVDEMTEEEVEKELADTTAALAGSTPDASAEDDED